jgi:hypothetical protein
MRRGSAIPLRCGPVDRTFEYIVPGIAALLFIRHNLDLPLDGVAQTRTLCMNGQRV